MWGRSGRKDCGGLVECEVADSAMVRLLDGTLIDLRIEIC